MGETTASAAVGGGVGDGGVWRIGVDTGGTFNDCIAVDPHGGVRRAKVLSTGTLRARVAAVHSRRRLLVQESWGFGGVEGFLVRVVGAAERAARVVRVQRGADRSELDLDGEINAVRGDLIELSTGEPAPILAARMVTQTPLGRELPRMALRLATTRGTNALLERRAGPVAFFVTRGFGDLLTIGTQQRPDIFALEIVKARALYDAVVEVDERVGVDGSVLKGLELGTLAARVEELKRRGIVNAAVALMHSWINAAHERAVGEFLRRHGFAHVSHSAEMGAAIKYLPRAQTTVVNTYLAPVIDEYMQGVGASLGAGSSLHAMTSGGGVVAAGAFHAKDSLLSGPAGGVVGAARAARRSGFTKIISFDMGGTSTDVARYDGDHAYVFEHQVGDAHIVAPAVAVESVAAGGGSVCWFDEVEGALRVGPRSAGANPGPACYGVGGPLTITDVNLLLGRLEASRFEIPVSAGAARLKAEELREAVRRARGQAPAMHEMLEGLIALADERMAQAILTISAAKGYDAAEHTLVAFGGAGGQHACAVAARLGIGLVLIPEEVGLLSAAGLMQAPLERFAQKQVLAPLARFIGSSTDVLAELEDEARRAVVAQGADARSVVVRRRIVNLRLVGQDVAIGVDVGAGPGEEELRAAFGAAYRSLYGYTARGGEIEVESVRVVASTIVEEVGTSSGGASAGAAAPPKPVVSWFGGRETASAVFERSGLGVGAVVDGPALILEAYGTTVVAPGWRAMVDSVGALVLEDRGAGAGSARATGALVVKGELLIARLMSIAADMGETLRRTAVSTNVKERLDYSCAVLDAEAQLVVNAPHIPVHLGALGLSVRMLREAISMGPGDVVVTNHPAFGGSHLPDVTVVTPVHGRGGRLLAYVASRAHHAEIGGTRPGSMPPGARTLAEEGVVIAPMHLVEAGNSRLEDLRKVLVTAAWPTRNVEDNLADIRAQIAANHRGAEGIAALAEADGEGQLAGTMGALTTRAYERTRAALKRFAGKTLSASESMDDGAVIEVSIAVGDDGHARINFSGSAPTHAGNFNAPLGVVRSAVMYVLRLLIDQPLPLNEGILRAVELVVPEGMLNPRFDSEPGRCPAVAAGNCETSQRVVDTLLKAFGIAACSQGTMNNLIFGNARFGYYETICGGSGATAGGPGADAVHTHMTNTRITDPEVLEHRYPVRLERFAVRAGSGGAGVQRGGDGAVREYTFLEPVSISLLTQHRVQGPYGTQGGKAGAVGRQRLVRPDGTVEELPFVSAVDVAAGTRLVIDTPGGGGWGAAR